MSCATSAVPLTTHHRPPTACHLLPATHHTRVLQVRLFRRTDEWRLLLIAADGAGRALAPSERTRRVLQQRRDEARRCLPPHPPVPTTRAAAPAYLPLLPLLSTALATASAYRLLTAAPHRRPLTAAHLATRHRAQVRMLDSARWEGIAAEVEPHLPPLLLRVALRESVKADTAPYRRHMVVLSHLEAVTEAKRRLGLQVQVCRPAALRDYLGWLQQTRASHGASVAARG